MKIWQLWKKEGVWFDVTKHLFGNRWKTECIYNILRHIICNWIFKIEFNLIRWWIMAWMIRSWMMYMVWPKSSSHSQRKRRWSVQGLKMTLMAMEMTLFTLITKLLIGMIDSILMSNLIAAENSKYGHKIPKILGIFPTTNFVLFYFFLQREIDAHIIYTCVLFLEDYWSPYCAVC